MSENYINLIKKRYSKKIHTKREYIQNRDIQGKETEKIYIQRRNKQKKEICIKIKPI